MKRFLLSLTILISLVLADGRSLLIQINGQEFAPNRTLIPLTFHGTNSQPIQSARLWAFALDAEGKVVGQRAIWLNGNEGQPWLEADAETEFNVVLRTTSEAVNTQVVITRIILADGTVINPQEGDEAMPEPKPFVPASD